MTVINRMDIDYKIFKNFVWSEQDNLNDLAKFNIIFGWNGTGKSTISNILYSQYQFFQKDDLLENVQNARKNIKFYPKDPFYEDVIGEKNSKIRVFNSRFIQNNINFFKGDEEVEKILVLGADNKEALDKYKKVSSDLEKEIKKHTENRQKKEQAERDLEKLFSDIAKEIKDKLQIKSDNEHLKQYSNYDKTKLKKYLNDSKGNPKTALSDEDLSKKIKIIKENSKEPLVFYETPAVEGKNVDFNKLPEIVSEVLAASVVSKTIQRLTDNTELSEWVEKGLLIHKDKEDCEFCGNKINSEVITKYEKHFDKSYKDLMTRIENGIAYLSNIHVSDELHKKNDFYQELQDEYTGDENNTQKQLSDSIKNIKTEISNLIKNLENKKTKMFSSEEFSSEKFSLAVKSYTNSVETYNAIISRHNKKTETLDADKVQHAENIVDHIIQSHKKILKDKGTNYSTIKQTLDNINTQITDKRKEKSDIETQLINSKKPINDINQKLKIYLGRDELTLEDEEKGYKIRRNHQAIKNDLSEGEKTAIAFLYFLQMLEDKEFNKEEALIVIDDPVTSMDENFIYSAYSFMKHTLKKIKPKQIIILTHNITFLRFLKMGYTKNTNLYIVKNSKTGNGERFAYLENMGDKMKKSFSSYHILFEIIDRVSKDENEDPIYYANTARQLLESFFTFKRPNGNLETILSETTEGTRIWRYCNTLSHESRFPNESHAVDTNEGDKILEDIMKLIENEDKKHYDEMCDIVSGYRSSS